MAAGAAAAGAPPGFGVVQATHSFLSAPLLTSQTEQTQVPALGLNRSIREGCWPSSVFFSSAFGFSDVTEDFSPKPKLGFGDESSFLDPPNEKLGLAGSDFSPKPNPVLAGSADFSPKRKLGGGFVGSAVVVVVVVDDILPKEKPVTGESLGLAAADLSPNENPVLAGSFKADLSPKANATFFSGSEVAGFAPKENPVVAGLIPDPNDESLGALPVPKAKTGATDFAVPSETALSGEVNENELFVTGLKKTSNVFLF